jgi:hypothetical protein
MSTPSYFLKGAHEVVTGIGSVAGEELPVRPLSLS